MLQLRKLLDQPPVAIDPLPGFACSQEHGDKRRAMHIGGATDVATKQDLRLTLEDRVEHVITHSGQPGCGLVQLWYQPARWISRMNDEAEDLRQRQASLDE